VVGRACGELLANEASVFYAGRGNADFHLDVVNPGVGLPEGLNFDVVIHAAADFGGNTEDDFCRAENVNALGVLNVCKLARRAKAGHLVQISSISACYQPQHAFYNIYSLSKRHGDELAQLYCETFGLPLTILRPTQVYDADSRCRKHQPFFYTIIDKVQQGEDIVFSGTNDALRNYIFLNDLAEIVAKTVGKNVLGVFNCPAPLSVRLSEIASLAQQAFGRDVAIRFQRDKPDIADLPVVDDQQSVYPKIQYSPATSLAAGILKIKQARERL
jgi:nucleoside-diphosphate-sugar epimerase